jgi:hypothetical protein
MLARLTAAILIAVFALVGTIPAGAEPRGHGWGRSRGRSRGRGHGWGHHYRPENPLPGFLGGIFGGWLAQQMEPDEPDVPFRDEEIDEDDSERDRR